MKKRKNLIISLSLIFLIPIFALTVQSQQRHGVGQVTQKAIPPQPVIKTPTIDPNLLRRLQASMPRATLINTLMGNPATSSVLENLAKNAKIQSSELQIKTLYGNPLSPAPQGQLIDQLNWSASIKFSMIKNRPTFFDPADNVRLLVGRISLQHASLYSASMDYYINNDAFPFLGTVELNLSLPSTPAIYMIATQTLSIMHPDEMTLSVRNANRKIQNIFPLGSGRVFVALTQVVPHPHIYRGAATMVKGDSFHLCEKGGDGKEEMRQANRLSEIG